MNVPLKMFFSRQLLRRLPTDVWNRAELKFKIFTINRLCSLNKIVSKYIMIEETFSLLTIFPYIKLMKGKINFTAIKPNFQFNLNLM